MPAPTSAGGIFGIVWLVIWMPVYLIGAGWFWHRREIQPIKARSPYLVLVCDSILILYVLVSCLQRILADAYPCYLNLWASYIGTLVLLNTYLIRCWHLYFKYFLTQEKLKVSSFDENSTFFVRHRRYTDVSFVSKVLFLIGLLLLIPPAVLSSTNRDNLTSSGGEECDKAWGDAVLACYVGGYILVFIGFGWNLRQVVDGFMIKEELRFTAVVGVATVIPWFIFNNIFRSVNTDIFPFSTFIIVVAVTIQLVASTGWPLYRSIYQPLALEDLHVPDDIATLRGLLSDADGFASFKNFLSHEFSVENILFWKEVEDFRAKKLKNLGSLELLGEAQSIYAKYIIRGAPFEVNLPSAIVVDLQKRLKEEYGGLAAVNRSISRVEFPSSTSTSKDNEPLVEAEPEKVPTIFDAAQRNIFHLMETDSYQRYIASSEYAQLTQQYMQRARKKEVLLEMQVI